MGLEAHQAGIRAKGSGQRGPGVRMAALNQEVSPDFLMLSLVSPDFLTALSALRGLLLNHIPTSTQQATPLGPLLSPTSKWSPPPHR